MAITIRITDKEVAAAGVNPEDIGTSMGATEEPKKEEIKIIFGPRFIKVKLNIRKTLDNNIVIYDHPLIDIVIIPSKNKIFTIPKDNVTSDTYPAQNRYFKFLDRKGVLIKGTIRSGAIINSLESFYPPNDKIDVMQVIILLTKRFMEKEMEFIDISKNYEENVEDMYVNPEEEDTTELGEVPQKPRKGHVNIYQTAYGILYRV
jgi:hypothetical protein